ncbi:MAG TPA: hypothetical protein VKC56_01920 [Gallionellaceae bacterium]|nr:hypothetical protein [Gallionellaceae bacterium]
MAIRCAMGSPVIAKRWEVETSAPPARPSMGVGVASMQTIGEVLTGLLVYGGGPTAVAYLVFRFLAERWIESKFAAQLETERHEHQKELQELKKKLDSELSKIIKLQDREFSVLGEAWGLLHDALGKLNAIVAMFQEFPDLSRLTDEQLRGVLGSSKLSDAHQEEVRVAQDRNKRYQELLFWYDLHSAKTAWSRYRDYINKNDIFLRSELSDSFKKINGLMWNALVSRQVGQEANDVKFWVEASQTTHDEIQPLLDELRNKVRKLLRGDEVGEPA